MSQLEGRKSRCRLVTTMTKRSNHMPTLTRTTIGYMSSTVRRTFRIQRSWGKPTLQATMIQ